MKKLEEKIADILIDKNLTITVAESCTGGLVNSRLTDVSGSSAYVSQGFVTYANKAKQKYLGVKTETLQKFGAVSEQTVTEMVEGILQKTDADIALATSGIAGPNSDNSKKPVGLLFIGVGNRQKKVITKFTAETILSRIEMKDLFTQKALDELYKFLNTNYF